MLRDESFKGIMTAYKPIKKDSSVLIEVDVKHVSKAADQFFLESFSKKLDIPNIQTLFYTPVTWNSIKIDLVDYCLKFDVTFDAIEFSSQLSGIVITRKVKNGVTYYEYNLKFIKEFEGDNRDSQAAVCYLKHKEENEEGKKEFVEYEVKLTSIIDKPVV